MDRSRIPVNGLRLRQHPFDSLTDQLAWAIREGSTGCRVREQDGPSSVDTITPCGASSNTVRNMRMNACSAVLEDPRSSCLVSSRDTILCAAIFIRRCRCPRGKTNIVTDSRAREEFPPGGKVNFGGHHRLVQLTTPSVGYTTMSDPPGHLLSDSRMVDRIIGDSAQPPRRRAVRRTRNVPPTSASGGRRLFD